MQGNLSLKIGIVLSTCIIVLISVGILVGFSESKNVPTGVNSASVLYPECKTDQLNQVITGFRSGVRIPKLTNSAVGMIVLWHNISSENCSLGGFIAVQFISQKSVISVDEVKGLPWLTNRVPRVVNLKAHGGMASGAIFYLHYPHPPSVASNAPWYDLSCPKIDTINLGISKLSGNIYIGPVKLPNSLGSDIGNNFTPCPRVVAVSYFQSGANANNDWPPPQLPVQSTTTTTDPSQSTTSIASASTPFCSVNQLKFQWSRSNSGAGSSISFILIQNKSSVSCAIQGVPSFTFYGVNGSPLPQQDQAVWDHNSQFSSDEPITPQKILLLPNNGDYAMVGWFFAMNLSQSASSCVNVNTIEMTWETGNTSQSTDVNTYMGVGSCLRIPPEYSEFIQVPLDQTNP